MNKKGFAISVILYSIVFLIIVILYMLFGIVKTRYTTAKNLRENIVNDLNVVRDSYEFLSGESCYITGSSDYVTNLEISINLVGGNSYGKSYKFNNGSWGTSNKMTVDHSGIYIGYFRDKSGGVGSCSTDITSKTLYRYRDCANANYTTYIDNNGQEQQEYVSCNSYGSWQEWSSTEPKQFRYRDCTGAGIGCGNWSSWSDTKPDVSIPYREVQSKIPVGREIESRISYKIK